MDQILLEQLETLLAVLNDAEHSLRAGDMRRMNRVIFVWTQRRDHLLAGDETWEQQNIGPVTFGCGY